MITKKKPLQLSVQFKEAHNIKNYLFLLGKVQTQNQTKTKFPQNIKPFQSQFHQQTYYQDEQHVELHQREHQIQMVSFRSTRRI